MIIFDDFERTETGPAMNQDTRFCWINNCAEPYAQRVRDQFEDMIANYPENDRKSLILRLRDDDDSVHRSAVLELVLHEWILAQGYEVLALEPDLPHTTKRPDFLVRSPDGAEFFLEATARKEDHDHVAAIKDHINQIDSPVYLAVKISGQPTQTLSARKVAKRVSDFIAQLDLDKDRREWEILRWEEKGLTFRIEPISLKSEKNRNARTIGAFHSGAGVVSSTGDLERVIKTKAGRYGELDKPYVVATTSDDFTTKLYELTAALFGSEAVAFNPNDRSLEPRLVRNHDGIWRGHPDRWTNTGLSAVLHIPDLSMSMFARRKPLLMLHPEARHPFDGSSLNAETYALLDEMIEKTKEGSTLGESLGLADVWPE